ncbi:MAG: hypothetical protein LC102_00670 [Ignavibacteriales bacterium]|nr:MAG: hypothetical protein F9K26_03610 [Ignavibacteriaceae bacterium]MBW7872521.1 hypothetical protein [Ignavibacteria bacterium]MCZ2141926.1 hypothetical protein [Ignavibacteriales bacterium]OQY79544.1 MAG: hypothetical protein B6D45_00710 [Ignavibacteriales bacterium UTCHB3]MBV6445092.1 hypothetical protein [Ignavibacteriaceae bacterium]
MVSKIKIFLFALLIVPASFNLYAQNSVTDEHKLEVLDQIYRNLEYNTSAFNDLREKWIVIDPVLVRAVFNKFLVNNALRLDGKKPKLDFVKQKVEDIYNGEVFIDLRKRFYDDEINNFRFYSEDRLQKSPDSLDYFFDPVEDYVRIQDVVGKENYELLKAQRYAFNDVTKSYYDEKLLYKFDINFSLLSPYLTFYNFTTNDKNKYLISAFGEWGNDKITIPGWYSPVMNAGLRVTYIDRILNNRPNDIFSFDVGMGVPLSLPFANKEVPHGRRYFMTGQNLYFNVKGNFLKYIGDYWRNYDIQLQGSVTMNTFEPGEIKFVNEVADIYSIRNTVDLTFERKNFVPLGPFGNLGASLGVGIYDVTQYHLDPSASILTEYPAINSLTKFYVQAQGIFSKDYALFAYQFAPTVYFNVSEMNLYYGLNLSFMVRNSIGFEFKFYSGSALGSDPIPGYRESIYVAFSPIFRINY